MICAKGDFSYENPYVTIGCVMSVAPYTFIFLFYLFKLTHFTSLYDLEKFIKLGSVVWTTMGSMLLLIHLIMLITQRSRH